MWKGTTQREQKNVTCLLFSPYFIFSQRAKKSITGSSLFYVFGAESWLAGTQPNGYRPVCWRQEPYRLSHGGWAQIPRLHEHKKVVCLAPTAKKNTDPLPTLGRRFTRCQEGRWDRIHQSKCKKKQGIRGGKPGPAARPIYFASS